VSAVESTMRGSGRTTKQMKDAPQGAVFVWCNASLNYPRNLAMQLGRTDLRIFGPSVFDEEAYRLRGLELPAIVLDHAYYDFKENRTPERAEGLACAQVQIRPKAR
jgi:hypothetical protein